MKQKGISQEGLKLLACVTMLIDHIGAVFVPLQWLRIVGRIAFPIYCFLLAEGVRHTRAPAKYGFRLAVGMLLSEIPFDYLFFGGWTFQHQSVMVTLLMGFLMAQCMARTDRLLLKVLILLPFAWVTERMHTDYGGWGIALIGMFILTEQMRDKWLLRLLAGIIIFYAMNSYRLYYFGYAVPIEMFALLALIPIYFYRGGKRTSNRLIQWGFYLFYPVHLTALLLIRFLR